MLKLTQAGDVHIVNVLFSLTIVAEPHHIYADPAPGENFDDVPVAMAPTLLYSKPKIFEGIKVNIRSDILFSSDSV
jgi:hypothetical protein